MEDREQPDTELDIQFKTVPAEESPVEGIRSEETYGVRIVMSHDVSEQIDRFAASDTTKEVGGILLGRIIENSGERTVLIQAHVEARFTEARQGSVTFTHQSWDYIHNEREQKYPELSIVGWFHSHPGFGIFLSSHDLFIHRNFFEAEWQLAYVVDPKSHAKGFFRRDGDDIVKCKFHIGGERIISDFAVLRQEHAKCQRQYLRVRRTNKWLIGVVGAFSILFIFYSCVMNTKVTDMQNSIREKEDKIRLLENQILTQNHQPVNVPNDSRKGAVTQVQETKTAPSNNIGKSKSKK